MLPPSTKAPIEITPEVLAAQGESSARESAPAAPALPTQAVEPAERKTATVTAVFQAPELPSTDAPLSEIVAGCERIILAARIELEGEVRRATTKWMSQVGPAVRLVHRTKAFKELTDERGKPYKSFEKWAHERCGISRGHANRMVSAGPVMEALESVYNGPLTTRQVDLLAPILRQHSPEAVRQVWTTAEAAGNTGATQLGVTRDALGYSVTPEDYEPTPELPAAPDNGALLQVRQAARSLDPEKLRQAAERDPEGARLAARDAQRFAETLNAILNDIAPADGKD
jgi:hypothetical protein